MNPQKLSCNLLFREISSCRELFCKSPGQLHYWTKEVCHGVCFPCIIQIKSVKLSFTPGLDLDSRTPQEPYLDCKEPCGPNLDPVRQVAVTSGVRSDKGVNADIS